MQYADFLVKIKEIHDMGFVETHRKGDTGIGKTLEDLLGIAENNIAGPDFSNYELKSQRKQTQSMLTLFTKAPNPRGANKELLNTYGYPHRKTSKEHRQATLTSESDKGILIPEGDKELHVTVDALKPNSVGLVLEAVEDKLYLGKDKGVEAYYDESTLREAFSRKNPDRLIYVLADHHKKGSTEYFWYQEAYRLVGFSFKNLMRLIQNGTIKIDIRIGHYPDGRLHDHGTGFRIRPTNLPECYETMDRIL